MSTISAIGISTCFSSSSWAAYWKSHLFDEDDVSLWATKRSGSYLQDVEENNIAEIHTGSLKLGGTIGGYYADEGALDILANSFTIAIWCEDTSTVDAYRTIFGKLGQFTGAYPVGSYGFFTTNTGFGRFWFRTDSTIYQIQTPNKLRTYGKCLLLAEIDITNKIGRFFLNGVQMEGDKAFLGDFPAMNNGYQLCIGMGRLDNFTGYTNYWTGRLADGYVFKRLLTVTEKSDLLNRKVVTGAAVHYPLLTPYNFLLYDYSGNERDITFTDVVSSSWENSIMGSKQGMEKGFNLYTKNGSDDVYIANLDDGVTPLLSGYSDFIKYGSYLGNSINHNGAESYLLFYNDFFDRSNSTIYSDLARKAFATDVSYRYRQYAGSLPKRWHIIEFCTEAFDMFFNSDYKNRLFEQGNFNPYDNDKSLREFVLYNTTKAGTDLKKVQVYFYLPYTKAGVALVFDDLTRIGTWTTYMDELKRTYGLKCSFAINAVNEATLNVQAAGLLKFRGWNHCLANHTVNHIVWDEYLLTHTAQEFYDTEVAPLQGWMNTLLGAYPLVFCYANTGGSDAALNTLLLASGFEFVRPGIYGGVAPTLGQSNYDGSVQVVDTSTEGALSEVDYSDFYALIDYAYNHNIIFLMLAHNIAEVDNGTTTTMAIARLKAYLAYVVSKNMKFYRFDELLPSLFA